MWDYFLVFVSVVLLAISFMVGKLKQTESRTLEVSIKFSLLSAPVIFFVLFAINGFTVAFSPFSVINCALKTLCGSLYGVCGFEIMRRGNVAIYTLFLMSGGMLVPAVFGWIFLGEPVLPLRILGVAVIIFSVILSNISKQKLNFALVALCVLVFFLNGGVSVFSKLHQINVDRNPVSSLDYMLIGDIFAFIFNVLILACITVFKKRTPSSTEESERSDAKEGNKRARLKRTLILLAIPYAATLIGYASYFLQLEGARNLPASVLYPMITGGSVVLSGIFAFLFFKERLNKREWISLIICFIGTCLFL